MPGACHSSELHNFLPVSRFNNTRARACALNRMHKFRPNLISLSLSLSPLCEIRRLSNLAFSSVTLCIPLLTLDALVFVFLQTVLVDDDDDKMADTNQQQEQQQPHQEAMEPPQTNGAIDGLTEEEKSKMRPADIDAVSIYLYNFVHLHAMCTHTCYVYDTRRLRFFFSRVESSPYLLPRGTGVRSNPTISGVFDKYEYRFGQSSFVGFLFVLQRS